MTTEGLTATLARKITRLTPDSLPEAACHHAERGFADTLAMIMAGWAEAPVQILIRALGAQTGPQLFHPARPDPERAALINGTAAQALDFDDTGLDGHPSAVLVPTILALAPGHPGAQMLTAYAAGFEVWAALLEREADPYHARGLHPTGMFGTVAAAAAAARMLHLDATQTAHALAIAASFASGIVANFGSLMKPVQTGRAAEGGLRAARLAAAGLTGAGDALEHRHGFLRAFSPHGRATPDLVLDDRAPLALVRRGLNLKLYPVCYAAHRLVDAALDLRATHAPRPDDIAAIRLYLGQDQAAPLREFRPGDVSAARFSAEFASVAALLFGQLGLAELQASRVQDPLVQRLMALCTRHLSAERDAQEPLFAPDDRIEVTLRDGRVLASTRIARPAGHACNPASEAELHRKFTGSLQPLLPAERAEGLFSLMRNLRALTAWDEGLLAPDGRHRR